MTLPLIRLSGSPYEQGVQHGRALQSQIAQNLAIYFNRFEREAKLPAAAVLARAHQYATAIAVSDPEYYAGMQGIAAGSGCDLAQIAALNVRYELLYYQFGQNATAIRVPDGCTAFAVSPTASANGHLVIGENWDWIPEVRGALLHTTEPNGLQTLGFTEAGIFGAKIGLNSAGIGLLVNGMTTTEDDWARLSQPFHARCRAVLRSADFHQAIAIIEVAPRACAANFLIAQTPDQIVNIEAAPQQVQQWHPEAGHLCHTNHFLEPRTLGVYEPEIERGPDSQDRLLRMNTLLATPQPLTIPRLMDALRDAQGVPDAICRHPNTADPPEERYATVVSVLMDLTAQTLWISDGPPDQAPYTQITLAELAEPAQ